jgi:hypothetical protein
MTKSRSFHSHGFKKQVCTQADINNPSFKAGKRILILNAKSKQSRAQYWHKDDAFNKEMAQVDRW